MKTTIGPAHVAITRRLSVSIPDSDEDRFVARQISGRPTEFRVDQLEVLYRWSEQAWVAEIAWARGRRRLRSGDLADFGQSLGLDFDWPMWLLDLVALCQPDEAYDVTSRVVVADPHLEVQA